MCGPWEPAFDSKGNMVIGFNPYLSVRFPMIYHLPLQNPLPVEALGDLYSWPVVVRFDQFDNLYVIDSNRSRILIYKRSNVPLFSVSGGIKTPDGKDVSNVVINPIGYASEGKTDISGQYTITNLVIGKYTLVPNKTGCTFIPASLQVEVTQDQTEQNFIAVCNHEIYLPIIRR